MLKKEIVSSLLEVINKKLPKDKEVDLIDEILDNRWDEIDEMLSNNIDYKNYLDKINAQQKELSKSLIQNLYILKLLDNYINLSTENLSYCNELFYKIGLKDGLTILLSAIGDDVNAG